MACEWFGGRLCLVRLGLVGGVVGVLLVWRGIMAYG